jgi:hypothetical protein
MDLADVKYDALLTKRRTLSDPEVVRVRPGQTVRLRIIGAGSGTNFFPIAYVGFALQGTPDLSGSA